MARYRRKFSFEALAPDETVLTCQVVHVVLPAVDGMLGVLGGRGPLVAMLGAGPMKVQLPEGKPRHFYVAGGFAHVHDGALTILADECIPAERLDAERAAAELDAARRMPAVTPEQVERWRQAVGAARKKFNMAVQWRHERASP